jgi:hypothetical protein
LDKFIEALVSVKLDKADLDDVKLIQKVKGEYQTAALDDSLNSLSQTVVGEKLLAIEPDIILEASPFSNRKDISPDDLKGISYMHYIVSRDLVDQVKGIRIGYEKGQRSGAEFPSKAIVDSMTNEELAAINFYTRRGDRAVNPTLRSGNDIPENSSKGIAIRQVNEALDKLPPYDGEAVYRYVMSPDPDTSPKYEVGDRLEEKAFLSTTKNRIYSETKKAGIAEGAHSRLLFVISPKSQGSNARAIEGLSEYMAESEVLFKTNTKFVVVYKREVPMEYSPQATQQIVYLQEI